jgi:hypothetical protein
MAEDWGDAYDRWRDEEKDRRIAGRHPQDCGCFECAPDYCGMCDDEITDGPWFCPCGVALHDTAACREEHYDAEHYDDDRERGGEDGDDEDPNAA